MNYTIELWGKFSEVYRCNIMQSSLSVTFFPGTPVSSTNKTDRHDITELLIIVESGVKHHKPTLNQSVKTNGA
jgi:hypothetical protein